LKDTKQKSATIIQIWPFTVFIFDFKVSLPKSRNLPELDEITPRKDAEEVE